MDDLQFYVLFNSSSAMSGRWAGDNGWLCPMSCNLKFLPQAELEPQAGTALDEKPPTRKGSILNEKSLLLKKHILSLKRALSSREEK